MEAGNYTGNNVKNRPYRWQGKGPRPPHKQPPPKRVKKESQIEIQLHSADPRGGGKITKAKQGRGKNKMAKMAYSTTLKKVDTRTVSNNMATTSNSIYRIVQANQQQQHLPGYTTASTTSPATPQLIMRAAGGNAKTRKKHGNEAGATRYLVGEHGGSDDDLVNESGEDEDDVSIATYTTTEQVEGGNIIHQQQQQQVIQQIVPQVLNS